MQASPPPHLQGFKLDRPDDRVLVANVARHIALYRQPQMLRLHSSDSTNASAAPKWLTSFVVALVTASKDKNSAVCAAAEEALVALCNFDAPGVKSNEAYSVRSRDR